MCVWVDVWKIWVYVCVCVVPFCVDCDPWGSVESVTWSFKMSSQASSEWTLGWVQHAVSACVFVCICSLTKLLIHINSLREKWWFLFQWLFKCVWCSILGWGQHHHQSNHENGTFCTSLTGLCVCVCVWDKRWGNKSLYFAPLTWPDTGTLVLRWAFSTEDCNVLFLHIFLSSTLTKTTVIIYHHKLHNNSCTLTLMAVAIGQGITSKAFCQHYIKYCRNEWLIINKGWL